MERQLGSMQCVEYVMLYAGMLSYCKGELVHGQFTDGINNTWKWKIWPYFVCFVEITKIKLEKLAC